MSPTARRGDSQSQRHHLHTRSATASTSSRSSSGHRTLHEEDGNRRFDLGDYTIDLANLGQSSAGGRDLFAAMGGSEIETPVREREAVASEDDGPEDFTINLGKWMRGDGEWKKEYCDAKEDEQKLGSIDIKNDPQPKERQASVGDMAEVEDEQESVVVTTAPHLAEKEVFEAREPSSTPPTTPINHRIHQDQSLRNSPPKSSALQFELENLRLQAESYRREIDALDQEREQLESDKENIAEELRTAKLSLEQSERFKVDYHQRWKDVLNRHEASAASYTSLQAKSESLLQELESARRHAESVGVDSAAKTATLTEQLQMAQSQLAELPGLKAQALTNAEELNALRSQLAQCKQDLKNEQTASKAREETLTSQSEDLRGRLTAAEQTASNVTILNRELEHSQAQLAETIRLLETMKDENDRFTQENERQVEEIKELKNDLIDSGRSAQALQDKVKEKDVRLAKLEGDVEKLQLDLASAETHQAHPEILDSMESSDKIDTAEADMRLADQLDTLSTHYEEELAFLKRVHEAEMKKLKGTLLRAADGMRKREARITSAHAGEVRMLRESVTRLEQEQVQEVKRSSVDPSRPRKETETRPTKDRDDVDELRSAIRVLSSKFKTAHDELRRAREEIRELKIQGEERDREQQEREEDQAAVNRALEERLESVFQKREKEWRRRIRMVLRDRDTMGKALMWSWGKDEVGEREREVKTKGSGVGAGERVMEKGMGYRYQFAKR